MLISRCVTFHFRFSRYLSNVNLDERWRVHGLRTFKQVPDKGHFVIRLLGAHLLNARTKACNR